MSPLARTPRTIVFARAPRRRLLELPREEALQLLEWLGLGRPEFGAIEARLLLPLCRRRLWPEPRNAGPLRAHVEALAAALRDGADAVVSFG